MKPFCFCFLSGQPSPGHTPSPPRKKKINLPAALDSRIRDVALMPNPLLGGGGGGEENNSSVENGRTTELGMNDS